MCISSGQSTSSYAERFVVNALVGIIVGLLAKEREMAATISLAVLGDLLAIQSMLMATGRTADLGYLWTLPSSFAFSLALVAGGAIVRLARTRSIRRLRIRFGEDLSDRGLNLAQEQAFCRRVHWRFGSQTDHVRKSVRVGQQHWQNAAPSFVGGLSPRPDQFREASRNLV